MLLLDCAGHRRARPGCSFARDAVVEDDGASRRSRRRVGAAVRRSRRPAPRDPAGGRSTGSRRSPADAIRFTGGRLRLVGRRADRSAAPRAAPIGERADVAVLRLTDGDDRDRLCDRRAARHRRAAAPTSCRRRERRADRGRGADRRRAGRAARCRTALFARHGDAARPTARRSACSTAMRTGWMDDVPEARARGAPAIAVATGCAPASSRGRSWRWTTRDAAAADGAPSCGCAAIAAAAAADSIYRYDRAGAARRARQPQSEAPHDRSCS